MNIRYHMLLTVSITAVFACLSIGSHAIAQGYAPGGPPPGFYYQPPSMAPTGPSMYPGTFYISGGVRYYNNNGFRFNKPQQETIAAGNIGTPPFGPDDGIFPGQPGFGTPIPFGAGTGITGLQAFPLAPIIPNPNPRLSGNWIYQNGFINAADSLSTGPAVTCTNAGPPVTTSSCAGNSEAWPDTIFGDPLLGREVVLRAGVPPSCCDTTPVSNNIGQFQIDDTSTQTNNPASILNTNSINVSRVIDGTYPAGSTEVASLILNVDPAVFDNEVFRAQLWAPSIEIGYQATSLFDIYFGVSGYQTGQTFSKSFGYPAVMARRGFTDTFGFASDQDVAWPAGAFNSAHTIVSSEFVHEYEISVNGSLKGLFPTRTFFVRGDPGVPAENLQEDVTNKSDINLVEFRWAGRSWVPLWGMGRFGFSLGAIANAINYKISGTRTITALGPTFAGTVVLNETGNVDAWIANYGGFVGTDVELGVRNIFVKASGDWHFIVPKFTYQLMSIETEFDPTGFSLGLYGGLRF